jgi:putative metalloenzyme radical SAM/SPASM domain maturase
MGFPIVSTPPPASGPAFLPHPSKLFVEVTSRCNLRCAMCPKQAPGGRDHDGDMDGATFERLAPAFPRLETLVLNGIGESLLHSGLERFVAAARRDMPSASWIGFQTNGQLVNPARARSLVRAGVDRVCVSADAVAPEVFQRLRAGGRQDAVETALTDLHAAARAEGRPLALGVEFVAMRDNVGQLPDLVRWASRLNVSFVIVTHMLAYSEEMAGAAAFETSTDSARELFRDWKARAAAEGVDIDRYHQVFMRFRRSPEDERVVEWVSRMVEDAWSRGLTLHLRRLFESDEPLQPRVHAAFAEAAEAARTLGVDLRLPASVPTRDRRCDFVEGGSAFVSWDGDVHPCYFLWHRYHCYVGGEVKRVSPHSFGNLRAGDILQIWNGEPWRAFRGEVVHYEYPFCHDCNAALCSDVRGEVVEDCRMGTVPCAACMWCTGVFQCLQ